jgi:cobalt-zinc-cadmium resistance protein CzcA
MVVLFVMMLTGGIMAFRELNIEAYPDPTPPMVDVITQSPGSPPRRSSATSPSRSRRRPPGLRNLTSIRTISLYGSPT